MANKKSTPVPAETEALATVAPAGALTRVVNEYGEDSGEGLADVPANEKSIPFYNLLQSNNPEVEEKTVPGAEAGMFINSVSKELISGETGFIIQPVFVDRFFVEWKDRDKGGGLVGRHLFTSAEVQDAVEHNGGNVFGTKEAPLKLGENFLVDTRYLYFNVLDDTGSEIVGYGVLAGAKTKVKHVQNFITACDNVRGKPPIYMLRARVTSWLDKQKTSGKTFRNVRFLPYIAGKSYYETRILGAANPDATDIDRELYRHGKALREAIKAGSMKADFSAEGKEAADEGAEEKRHF